MGQTTWDHGSIPNKGKKFFFPKMFKTGLGTTQPPIQWVLEALSLGVKQPECEADHRTASSAEIKNRFNSDSAT